MVRSSAPQKLLNFTVLSSPENTRKKKEQFTLRAFHNCVFMQEIISSLISYKWYHEKLKLDPAV